MSPKGCGGPSRALAGALVPLRRDRLLGWAGRSGPLPPIYQGHPRKACQLQGPLVRKWVVCSRLGKSALAGTLSAALVVAAEDARLLRMVRNAFGDS